MALRSATGAVASKSRAGEARAGMECTVLPTAACSASSALGRRMPPDQPCRDREEELSPCASSASTGSSVTNLGGDVDCCGEGAPVLLCPARSAGRGFGRRDCWYTPFTCASAAHTNRSGLAHSRRAGKTMTPASIARWTPARAMTSGMDRISPPVEGGMRSSGMAAAFARMPSSSLASPTTAKPA